MGKNVKEMLCMLRTISLQDIIKMAGKRVPDGIEHQLNKKLIQLKK